MNRYILDTSDELALPLNAQYINFGGQNTDDKIHDFLLQNLNMSENICLIIPIQLGDEATLGLKIAMHVRCTHQLNESVRTCPIILLYEGHTDELLQLDLAQADHFFSLITQTKGVYLLSPLDAMQKMDNCVGTDIATLKKEMKNIPFFKTASDHNHSVANVWGAKVFQSFSQPKTQNAAAQVKNLQFKYLVFVHELYMPKVEKVPTLYLKSPVRFLLIDDHDKEWLPALQTIVGTDHIKSVPYDEKFSKYKQNILNIIQNDEYDIVLLDLRLDKEEENIQKKPKEYSGYEILKSIKHINKGTQVIIMTASNKAWNMKALMDIGADGYYVKEGPEYYDETSAFQNYGSFIKTLKECGERVYLRKLDSNFKTLRSKVKNVLMPYAPAHDLLEELMTFESSCMSKTEMVMDLLSKNKSSDGSKYYRFAFLLLYQLLEEYTSLSFIYQKAEDRKKQSKVTSFDGNLIDVFGPDPKLSGNIKCNFTLTNSGKYAYQTGDSKNHHRSVSFKSDTFKIDCNAKSQTRETTLFRLISVFKERHQFSDAQCADLIEMTYLRSNLCGHETGNIDLKMKDIGKEDVVRVLGVVMEVVK